MQIKPDNNGKNDTGEDLIGLDFIDEGVRYTITGTSDNDGDLTLTYVDPQKPLKNGGEHESTVKEVRKWYIRETSLRLTAVPRLAYTCTW